MRIVMFLDQKTPHADPRMGLLRDDGSLVDVARRASMSGHSSLRAASSVEELVLAGEEAWEAISEIDRDASTEDIFSASEVRLTAPLSHPNSFRDFIAFEDHARAGAARRNEELNPVWKERPLYYKGNHRSLIGPDVALPRPAFTQELDFEMEVGAIVGRTIRDASLAEAADSIFGLTIVNDWSARDIQRAEMAARLGPAKSKDFATSVGPCVLRVGSQDLSRNPSLQMTARVNGKEVCSANLSDAYWSFADMISFVSREETVWATDLYGSGTPFRGCMLDQGGPYLEPGDVVEIEVEGIGILRNSVV